MMLLHTLVYEAFVCASPMAIGVFVGGEPGDVRGRPHGEFLFSTSSGILMVCVPAMKPFFGPAAGGGYWTASNCSPVREPHEADIPPEWPSQSVPM